LKSFDYARDASTSLNWRDRADRIHISQNLRTNAGVLGAEMVYARSAEERSWYLKQVERVYSGLAVCDLVTAREAEVKAEEEERRAIWCGSVLEGMAAALKGAAMNPDGRADLLLQAQSTARSLTSFRDVFFDGRYGRLLKMSETVAEMDLDRAAGLYHALYEVLKMAEGFEQDKSPEAEECSNDIFAGGHKLLRRELGLGKESHEK
jgi:hypothetical protein